jgi:hypothetical protein
MVHCSHDQLIDDNPDVQKRVERGHVAGMRQLMIAAIKGHFPSLATQTQQQIEQIQSPNALEKLFQQLTFATTEDEARKILLSQKTGRKQKS